MARRGRKPIGPQLVERLEGSQPAKTRLRAILETLTGERTIPDVCQELGIQESMFHKLRGEVLQTALSRLEPRPLGRPRHPHSTEDPQVTELEEENQRLRINLLAAQVRHDLVEQLPRVSRPGPEPGKKTPPQTLKPRRGKKRPR